MRPAEDPRDAAAVEMIRGELEEPSWSAPRPAPDERALRALASELVQLREDKLPPVAVGMADREVWDLLPLTGTSPELEAYLRVCVPNEDYVAGVGGTRVLSSAGIVEALTHFPGPIAVAQYGFFPLWVEADGEPTGLRLANGSVWGFGCTPALPYVDDLLEEPEGGRLSVAEAILEGGAGMEAPTLTEWLEKLLRVARHGWEAELQ